MLFQSLKTGRFVFGNSRARTATVAFDHRACCANMPEITRDMGVDGRVPYKMTQPVVDIAPQDLTGTPAAPITGTGAKRLSGRDSP